MHLGLSPAPDQFLGFSLGYTQLLDPEEEVSAQRQEGEIVAAIQESSHIRQTLDLKEI